jgi:tetratricopeptide (TPR) repeat protein
MRLGLILSIATIMAGMFALDRFLASVQQAELRDEARDLYRQGEQLLKEGHAAEAVEDLRRALILARDNRIYQLALARALLAGGDLVDAEAEVQAVLDRDSNDGPANLVMARVQARAGHVAEAEAYYHRAIYGVWPASANVQNVRMELADLLSARGQRHQLLSELLLLQDHASADPQTQEKLAALFLKAGSPARAADVYRQVIREHRDDLAAHMGLGEAELATGNFRAAQMSFLDVLRRKPGDNAAASRLRFATALSTLDPTSRRLPPREKFDRSVRLLTLSAADLSSCAERAHAGEQAEVALANAADLLKHTVKSAFTNEAAEQRLTAVEQLWRLRNRICGSEHATDDPLPLIMSKQMQ